MWVRDGEAQRENGSTYNPHNLRVAQTIVALYDERDALRAEVERLRTAARLEEFAGAFVGGFWDDFFTATDRRKDERGEDQP